MSKFIFNGYTLKAHNIDGQTWFEAEDVATALGYAHTRSITGLYASHKSEFSNDMSQIIESVISGNYRKKTRVFSLRGVHLIAMFARTPVAEDFRKWVLDLIEREEANVITVSEHRADSRHADLPPGVYHEQSKYNPYRAIVRHNKRRVTIGQFPTVQDATTAIENYYRTGVVQRLLHTGGKAIDVLGAELPVPAELPAPAELTSEDRIDFINHMATFLEAAQLLSCYKFGKDLAWDLIAFAQEESRRANLRG